MKLSIVIPAHNEAETITETLTDLHQALGQARIEHEILVVNDNSRDNTEAVLMRLKEQIPTLRHVNNRPPNGFGFAVRCGLENFSGDAVAVVMADGSDAPKDVVAFFRAIEAGYDCAFGSRFIPGGSVSGYPPHKLVLNRAANTFVNALFGLGYNDITNAFKMYRREVIEGLQPLLSHHFNLTVELPLKAVVRGYTYKIIPNSWQDRKAGVSKLNIQEMGSRYLFIVLYCLLEKHLARGDYHRVAPSMNARRDADREAARRAHQDSTQH